MKRIKFLTIAVAAFLGIGGGIAFTPKPVTDQLWFKDAAGIPHMVQGTLGEDGGYACDIPPAQEDCTFTRSGTEQDPVFTPTGVKGEYRAL